MIYSLVLKLPVAVYSSLATILMCQLATVLFTTSFDIALGTAF